MKTVVEAIEIPRASEIERELAGSYFNDCYEVRVCTQGKSAMDLYLAVLSRTPEWVNVLMAVRNRAVSIVGLKNLGHLGAVDGSKPASTYRVGDRVGIFTLLYVTENEVVLGDSDKHLNVKVSVCKATCEDHTSIAVSTVVHVHNALGRAYMFLVAPVHKIIVPAMLARAPRRAADA
jgi:Protein of unknown function (DUF2867)